MFLKKQLKLLIINQDYRSYYMYYILNFVRLYRVRMTHNVSKLGFMRPEIGIQS